eukprot:1222275-Prymnesium_polylepis.2
MLERPEAAGGVTHRCGPTEAHRVLKRRADEPPQQREVERHAVLEQCLERVVQAPEPLRRSTRRVTQLQVPQRLGVCRDAHVERLQLRHHRGCHAVAFQLVESAQRAHEACWQHERANLAHVEELEERLVQSADGARVPIAQRAAELTTRHLQQRAGLVTTAERRAERVHRAGEVAQVLLDGDEQLAEATLEVVIEPLGLPRPEMRLPYRATREAPPAGTRASQFWIDDHCANKLQHARATRVWIRFARPSRRTHPRSRGRARTPASWRRSRAQLPKASAARDGGPRMPAAHTPKSRPAGREPA